MPAASVARPPGPLKRAREPTESVQPVLPDRPARVLTEQPPREAVAVAEGVAEGLTVALPVRVQEALEPTVREGDGVAVGDTDGQVILRMTWPALSATKTAPEGAATTPVGVQNEAPLEAYPSTLEAVPLPAIVVVISVEGSIALMR